MVISGGRKRAGVTSSKASPAAHSTGTEECRSHASRSVLAGLPMDGELETSGLSVGGGGGRHPDMPDVPVGQGELFFECTLFLYSVLALFLQYLNLYKTMWWLPNSHTHYAVKFHLIDPYLLSCVGLILGRRVTWCFLKMLTILPPPDSGEDVSVYVHVLEWTLKVPMLTAVMCSFMFSLIRVISTYPLMQLCQLVYPFVVYLVMFFPDAMRYVASAIMLLKGSPEYAKAYRRAGDLIDAEKMVHLCTASPDHIRAETSLMYADLCERTKQSLYSAFATAYFAVFIPCAFTPAALYVDVWWTQELVLVVFLTSLTLYATYLLPLQYCHLGHRVAAHLGVWRAVHMGASAAQQAPAYLAWSDKQLYTTGALVKHNRTLYRAEACSSDSFDMIAAEPGNNEHARFYQVCSDAKLWFSVLCVTEMALIVGQFLMLVHSTDWQHIVTLVLLMFANYLLLFKAFKDKVILGRFYSPSPEDLGIIERDSTSKAP